MLGYQSGMHVFFSKTRSNKVFAEKKVSEEIFKYYLNHARDYKGTTPSKIKVSFVLHQSFFSIFGGGAQHATKNRKKCKVFVSHFFGFLAAVRSTPPKIEKNAFVLHLIETVGPRPAAGAAEPGPTVSIKC